MFSSQDTKAYAMHATATVEAHVPRYVELLKITSTNRSIDGLRPWAFDHEPEGAVGFCSEAIGRLVLPFAQAIGEDMMACFEVAPEKTPSVVVINPWAESKAAILLAELPDFDAWLAYAKKVSQAVQVRQQQEVDDE